MKLLRLDSWDTQTRKISEPFSTRAKRRTKQAVPSAGRH